jgi:hypothetical protein
MSHYPTWKSLHPQYDLSYLGPFLPTFLNVSDPRPAAQQIDDAYVSGWSPFPGFEMLEGNRLKYPGDPAIAPLATTTLRDETLFLYEGEWLAIIQKDGSFEVCRVD